MPHVDLVAPADHTAPADFDFSAWLTDQALHTGTADFDFQGWMGQVAASQPHTVAETPGAGPSTHADAVHPAEHTGSAVPDDFDWDAFLRGETSLPHTAGHSGDAMTDQQFNRFLSQLGDGSHDTGSRPGSPKHDTGIDTRPAPGARRRHAARAVGARHQHPPRLAGARHRHRPPPRAAGTRRRHAASAFRDPAGHARSR